MIKGLMGNNGIVVEAGNTSLPYVNQNDSNTFQGIMRIRGNDIQYFDNGCWNNLSTSYATVKLDANTESLLKWCEAQRNMSLRRLDLAEKNPALMKALEAVKRAEDNFEILAKFVQDDEPGIVVGYNFNTP
jgi:hypothetical protein